jgi:TonB family protein
MNRESIFSVLLASVGLALLAQAAVPAAAVQPTNDDTTIHYKGPGVTAPELLSVAGRFHDADKCQRRDGEVTLQIGVDRIGVAHALAVPNFTENEFKMLALRFLDLDRFKPGTVDGKPATVAVLDRMKLSACAILKPDAQGDMQSYLQLRATPEQDFEIEEAPSAVSAANPGAAEAPDGSQGHPILAKAGPDVTPPQVIHTVEPAPPARHRRAGVCLVGLTVDELGRIQNVRVVKSLNKDADAKALEAVRQYRFMPALKDGVPVALPVKIEVNFVP